MEFKEHEYEGNVFFSRIPNNVPTRPAGYWKPSLSLSDVYYLRKDGVTWILRGVVIDPSELPDDLELLGEYA